MRPIHKQILGEIVLMAKASLWGAKITSERQTAAESLRKESGV